MFDLVFCCQLSAVSYLLSFWFLVIWFLVICYLLFAVEYWLTLIWCRFSTLGGLLLINIW